MENARVAIFEDDPQIQRLLAMFVVEQGLHRIVALARSIEEAVTAIDALEPDGLDVALVDGNLSPGREDSAEGAQIAAMLRAKFGDMVTIIGISGSNPIGAADINITKGESPVGMEVVQAIREI